MVALPPRLVLRVLLGALGKRRILDQRGRPLGVLADGREVRSIILGAQGRGPCLACPVCRACGNLGAWVFLVCELRCGLFDLLGGRDNPGDLRGKLRLWARG